jgi:hypothetical protein
MPPMRDILIVLLAALVLVAYLAFAPYVLEEYARYLVCYVRLVVLGGECTAPVP